MPDADHIRRIYERYPELLNKGDAEGIVELYAEDATIEDPIGSDLHRGRDAIRVFYQRAAASRATMRRTGPVRVAGHEAATPVVVLMGPEDQRSALDLISVMSFDEDGKIASMRAFWSMDAIRPATPEDQG
jgi:steroid delta-isomerase